MKLTAIDVSKNKEARKKTKALYLSAFPKEELVPWWIMRFISMRRGIQITAYYDGDRFCGFTHSVELEDFYFVTFFAVDASHRGCGYGSAILSLLKERGKPIALNVEPLTDDAPNPEERKNRLAFYYKNGFFDTDYDVKEIGGVFRILSTKQALNVKSYKKVFRKMSFGLWNVKVMPIKK